MGYVTPTPVQLEVIPLALSGRDVIATAETGSGKTAAFLLPMVQRLELSAKRGVRALILAPTREVAAQIGEESRAFGRGSRLRTAIVYGGVGMSEQRAALAAGSEIVVATPGRLLDHFRRGDAKLNAVEVLVIDEADRMMDMGFLPDLRRILSTLPRHRQSLLFSATMPLPLLELAYAEILRDPVHVEIGSPSAPPSTLTQSLYFVSTGEKESVLMELLKQEPAHSVLVFARTRRRADSLAKRLQRAQIAAACIHGDRTQRARERALEAFRSRKVQVLVATDVAARGLDIELITHVVNFDIPAGPQEYLHRVGRTARAGAIGSALTLASWEDTATVATIERTLGYRLPRSGARGGAEEMLLQQESVPRGPLMRGRGRSVRRKPGR